MNTTILQLLVTIAQALSAEGYDYEAYKIDQICGAATVAEVQAELDWITPADSVVRPAVELMGVLDGDVIVNIACDDAEYTWNAKE